MKTILIAALLVTTLSIANSEEDKTTKEVKGAKSAKEVKAKKEDKVAKEDKAAKAEKAAKDEKAAKEEKAALEEKAKKDKASNETATIIEASNVACAQDSKTANCGSQKVGTGLLKCIGEYKKANKNFSVSTACQEATKKLGTITKVKK